MGCPCCKKRKEKDHLTLSADNSATPVSFSISKDPEACTVHIRGRLDARGAAQLWQTLPRQISKQRTADKLILDLEHLDYLDTAGTVFLFHLKTAGESSGFKQVLMDHLKPEYTAMIELAKTARQTDLKTLQPSDLSFVETRGEKFSGLMSETKEFITYIGEITWAMMGSLRHPGSIRWADTFCVAERAGVNALGIVALVSFIVGLVMAFQAAIPMRMFGAELYVANLIGIAMVRELGPLMTAIVLAGRSASAFAAEIGTMRINEEIDALTVMGLDPVRFLIVPRIIASTIITPLLTIFSNLVGILGGALVITSMGYPIVSYYNQIVSFVEWNDFMGGLLKSFVFGILIAATGCIRGYQTQSGPSAVGISTTRAVVTSIVLIAVFDGIFSIMYYYLDI